MANGYILFNFRTLGTQNILLQASFIFYLKFIEYHSIIIAAQ